ncbi:hypothetical protein MA16_Dca013429 [Dendrobium catenatum]|uniref:Uncharacterized protein n=1 Tax=Dendrobium catenatum TaxID=906689 RepID=A0A2I0X2W4_9ASPA|nr:hypothetical protein MA16_Dca013429 [Dendrobium catenatum]
MGDERNGKGRDFDGRVERGMEELGEKFGKLDEKRRGSIAFKGLGEQRSRTFIWESHEETLTAPNAQGF